MRAFETTETKVKKHIPQPLQNKLAKLGLELVDKGDLALTLETSGKLVGENRMLRAKLARLLKNSN